MSNIKSERSWEKENNELWKQLVGVKKINRELEALIDSQRRLIARYRKEIDDLNLLLSVKIKEINDVEPN
jgi:predicted  nucleic acid-binding Zn-ribbon protein